MKINKKLSIVISVLALLFIIVFILISPAQNKKIKNKDNARLLSNIHQYQKDKQFMQIIEEDEFKFKTLQEDNKNIQEIQSFVNDYLKETKEFTPDNIDDFFDKEHEFFSIEAKKELKEFEKQEAEKDKILREQYIKDTIKYVKDFNVNVKIKDDIEFKKIILSPTGKNAFVYVLYNYEIFQKNVDENEDLVDDVFIAQPLNNILLMNIQKEKNEWKVSLILDGDKNTNLEDIFNKNVDDNLK